jgi:WD40 repeat protein/tetratricopeptide (TPR) repeat protein/tRNA A-37 threonylcarbamoyl transferase component Bud32
MADSDCISDENLRAFLLGELPEAQVDTIVQHLNSCRHCEDRAGRWDDLSDPAIRALRQQDRRKARLDEACDGRSQLRADVEALLRAHASDPDFLELPAGELGETLEEPATPSPHGPSAGAAQEQPGAMLAGRYRLLEEIGSGGMGTVWKAEQTEPVKRLVAVKLIRPGMDSAQMLARFEAERQALALMDHPNIARVLDAGATATGRPYFVMELVKGVPLTKYCDEHRLTPRERLELFVPVCQAIQHAHQKGIIHRDIKPSNVLVASYDGKPVPKVIDFGIAKAAGQQLTEQSLFTDFGAIVGTLEYMSPEQAEVNQLDIDTRSDIYSLGVLLYELLTGTTPLEKKRLKQASMLEVLRLIREEEPPKPSTRLSSTEELPSVAANRGLEPRKLSGLVRGELDWIVMKALEKDRNRRYETANGFALDLQRYLADEPVLACPPSAAYRLRKFARRNKALLTALAAIAATLFVAGATVTWKWWEAEQARVQERQAKDLAEGARDEAQKAEKRAVQGEEQAVVAERLARRRQAEALVGQAHANRLSGRPGRRQYSLELLAEAARLARQLGLAEKDCLELRNETIACLALVDLRLARAWEGRPAGTDSIDFDADLERYVRADPLKGVASVRRVADDSEVCRITDLGQTGRLGAGLSPDGRFLGVVDGRFGGREPLLKVWRVTGQGARLVLQKPGHDVQFSPDSRRVATLRADGGIGIYELPGGRPIKEWQSGPSAGDLAFHPTGRRVAVRHPERITVFETDTGNKLAEFRHPGGIWGLAWHPDGKQLAANGDGNCIYVWDASAGKLVHRLAGHTSGGIYLGISPAGDLLASYGWDDRLRLWDARSGRELLKTLWHSTSKLRFSRNGRLLAADITDHRLRLWEVIPACGYRSLEAFGLPGTLRVGKHRLLAIVMDDGVGLWELPGYRPLAFLPLVVHGHVTFEPSGALLVDPGNNARPLRIPIEAVGPPGTLRVGPPQPLPFPPSFQVATSRDGRVLASAQGWGALVRHADLGDQLLRLAPQHDVRFVAVSPDGRWVATGSHWHTDVHVKVWDARTGRPVADLPVGDSSQVGFSPEGRWLLTTGGSCRLWAVGTWREGPKIGGRGGFAFSPDGKLLAVETGTGAVRLLDPDTGREYARLEDPGQDRAEQLTFSPDGAQLFASTGDTSPATHVWDLRVLRAELAKRRLDWELPPYPPASTEKDQPPVQVTVDLGTRAAALPKQAVVAYSLAIALLPLNPEAYLRRGRAYYQLKEWHKAADDLGLALALNPGVREAQVWFEWGYAAAACGRQQQAFDAYSRTVELGPRFDGAWNNRGLVHEQFGRLGQALADYSQALAVNDRNAIAWNNRSRVYARLGRWNAAAEDCSRFLALTEGASQEEGFYRRATAYARLGRYREALADYQRLPNSVSAQNDLSWLLATCPETKLRDPARAVALAKKAVELAPEEGSYWNTLGTAHYRAGDWKAAVAAVRTSVEKSNGGSACDGFILAMAHWRLGEGAEARKHYGRAVQWLEKNEAALSRDKHQAEELRRFRAEAEETLGLKKK